MYYINSLLYFLIFRFSQLPNPLVKISTTIIGLGTIPVIIKPIDAIVETGMNSTVRKLYKIDE